MKKVLIIKGDDKGKVTNVRFCGLNDAPIFESDELQNAYEFSNNIIESEIIPLKSKEQIEGLICKYIALSRYCIEISEMLEKLKE